jgi:hypothetical protein
MTGNRSREAKRAEKKPLMPYNRTPEKSRVVAVEPNAAPTITPQTDEAASARPERRSHRRRNGVCSCSKSPRMVRSSMAYQTMSRRERGA